MNNRIDAVHTNRMDSTAQPKTNQLNQEGFMKLLLTQLKQQNPLSPFDSSTMMQQVSQLTALSSAQELQKTIGQLGQNMSASQVLNASQLVGKQVQILSDRSPLTESTPLKGSVLVPENAQAITVEIRNEQDQLIKTLQLSAPSSGVLDFEWNGFDEQGNKMVPGLYKMSAQTTINNEVTKLPTAGNFPVGSVAMDRGGRGVILNVDGLGGVYMDDVIKIL